MRVENGSGKPEQASATKSFAAELKKAHPRAPLPKPAAAARPNVAQARPSQPRAQAIRAEQQHVTQALGRAKNAAQKFASTLQDRRTHAEAHQPDRKRVAEKLAKLLIDEPRDPKQPHAQHPREVAPVAPVVSPTGHPAPAPAPQQASPAARAEALTAKIEQLLERVELLAKAEGPAIQLALSEGHAARLEVVRTGKGEVVLRLEARSGSERRALTSQVATLRAALAERGLRVREVTVS